MDKDRPSTRPRYFNLQDGSGDDFWRLNIQINALQSLYHLGGCCLTGKTDPLTGDCPGTRQHKSLNRAKPELCVSTLMKTCKNVDRPKEGQQTGNADR